MIRVNDTAPDEIPAEDTPRGRAVARALNIAAVIVAALYFGSELLIPIVLATILAFVLAPACAVLERARLPRALATMLVVLLAFAAIAGIGMVVVSQGEALAGQVTTFQSNLMQKWQALATDGGILHRVLASVTDTGGPNAAALLGLGNTSMLTLARTVALPLLGPLGTAGVVLVFTIFILLYSEDLRDRVVRLMGRRDLHRTILAMNDAARRLSRYFLFQLLLNTGFGVMIGGVLWAVGLPSPLLWGILAALMRFVPFLGIFVSVLPPLALAVAVAPGWTLALIVLAVFIGSEMTMGQVVEPLIYGHSTGLSPFAIIVATAFWALLWGPVGLLLATPLTVCLVVVGRHVQALAFFDIIFGDRSPLQPDETFYQRVLEGKTEVLATAARQQIAATSRVEYYDRVALPGLSLAQRDRSRDALAFDRLEAVHDQIQTLLRRLAGEATDAAAPGCPPAWRIEGAITCIPGRGQLDDLAADMAVQVLRDAGFGAQLAPNQILGAAEQRDLSHVRLCCLSVLEEGSSVAGVRYFIRRMQKRMPGALTVIALWHAAADSPFLAELRAQGGDEHLVLSIGELLAMANAVSARGEVQGLGPWRGSGQRPGLPISADTRT